MNVFSLDVSIVIPTLGRLNKIIGLCDVLLRLDPCPREILIVFQDEQECVDFNTYNSSTLIKTILIPIKSAVLARNSGLYLAESEYVVFLDDDCKPLATDWLQHIIEPFKNSKVGLVAGSVFGWESASGQIPFLNRAFLLIPFILEPIGNPQSTISGYCQTIAAGNFAARRLELKQIQGFSQNFHSPSLYEEIELTVRFKKTIRKRIWFSASASVYHDQSAQGGMRNEINFFSKRFILSQRKNLYFALRQNYLLTYGRLCAYFILFSFKEVVKNTIKAYNKISNLKEVQ
jgi:glycosyltransferase involved in cell wall biosynthesis